MTFLTGLATGLGFLEFNELTHRDLKPHNIMMDRKGLPRIIDFGSATHHKPLSLKVRLFTQCKI